MRKAVALMLALAITIECKPHEKKDRAYERDLSEIDHEEEAHEAHNVQYDHEAFLGKQESKVFDQLTPEESKKRLLKLVEDKIDANHDGFVSEEELRQWITHTSRRYIEENRNKHWSDFNLDINNPLHTLAWQEYKDKTFGNESSRADDPEGLKAMLHMINRDEKRWRKADFNNDGKLDKEEFLAFLHPEEVPRMHQIVVEETMDDMDKNKDGFVDLEEYINDLWTPETEGEIEPKWVASEREQFALHRDKDKDNRLSPEEVKEWILPKDYDHVESETKHLISHADKDQNKLLSKEEILEHYDLFVGSQATDFGEALNRHEEL